MKRIFLTILMIAITLELHAEGWQTVVDRLKKDNHIINGAILSPGGGILATLSGSPGLTDAEARKAARLVKTGQYPQSGFSINHRNYLYMGKPDHTHLFKCFNPGKKQCAAALVRTRKVMVLAVVEGSRKQASRTANQLAAQLMLSNY
jgi:hypothetical protein